LPFVAGGVLRTLFDGVCFAVLELATGRITKAKKIVVLKGDGWEEGLGGELVEKGKVINWANGSTWKRP
jgi:hypothetical protein